MLPLEGIKVVDLSRLLPGPYATMILADLGADVIKIEDTGIGDYIRAMPPQVAGHSAYFAALNRNKRSVALDLKKEEGKQALLDLVRNADVLVESFRPGVMDKLGLGYETCKAINPKLVYCSITGYGHNSPWRERAGHDINYLATAGVLSVNGSDADTGPQLSGVQIADVAGGSLWAVISIQAALRRVEKGEKGCFIDTAMTDGALALLSMVLGPERLQSTNPAPGHMQLNGRYVCYRIYRAADGYVSLGALEPKFWQGFCTAIDDLSLLPDQFQEAEAGNPAFEKISAIMAAKSRDEWEELNAQHDFCCEPVREFSELEDQPHVKARGLLFSLPGEGGDIPQTSVPVSFEGAIRSQHALPPEHAAHTDEVLRGIGWDEVRIAAARAAGAIA